MPRRPNAISRALQPLRVRTALCGMLLAFAAGCDRGQHPGLIGQPAPDFTVADGRQTFSLHQLRGQVVVLNFWATWCAPCIQELPDLEALHRDLPQVRLVGIATDQDADAYLNYTARHPISFPTMLDSANRSNALYGTSRFPETYVIDKTGVVRRKFIGPQPWTDPEIEDFLRKLAD